MCPAGDGLQDPKTGANFFNATARRRFENAESYCSKGPFFDVPGLEYYHAPKSCAGRKRCRRVASASGKKIRKGSLDKWKADDPEYDYDAAIAGFTAARVPGADPSTVNL